MRFVVVGDSCAEGLDDLYPDGSTYRGWADLVAYRLAECDSGVHYANLAVRGKRLDQIHSEQIAGLAQLQPDLVALFGGVNDLLQFATIPQIEQRVTSTIRDLCAISERVVVFTVSDISRQTVLLRRLRPGIAALNDAIRSAARAHGAILVDLAAMPTPDDERYFGPDRLHLSDHGHQLLAAHVVRALGIEPDPAWEAPLPGTPVTATARTHARWFVSQVLPVVWSRVRNIAVRRAPGDGFVPKRPELTALA